MRTILPIGILLLLSATFELFGASVVSVQPISVCSDAGTDCSNSGGEYFEAETDKIWSQAGIDVQFLPMTQLNSTAFQTIDNTTEFSSLANGAGNGQHASATVINMWFVQTIVGGGTVYGLGFEPGNGIAIADATFAFGGGIGRKDTLAHEIGHNLGLSHTADANTRLMAPGSLRGVPSGVQDIFPDGAMASQLTEAEITTALASAFVTPVPEPGAYALIALLSCGSFAARRRISRRLR